MAQVTHARVKYLDDKVVDVIPIENIIEFQKNKPKDVTDFDKKKVYRAEYTDHRNPEKVILRILISDLACSESEIEQLMEKRPIFEYLNDSDIPHASAYSNGSDSNSKELPVEVPLSVSQALSIKKNTIMNRSLSVINAVKNKDTKPIDNYSDSDTSEEDAKDKKVHAGKRKGTKPIDYSDSENSEEDVKKKKVEKENNKSKSILSRKDTEIKKLFVIKTSLQKQKKLSENTCSAAGSSRQNILQSRSTIDTSSVAGSSRPNILPSGSHEIRSRENDNQSIDDTRNRSPINHSNEDISPSRSLLDGRLSNSPPHRRDNQGYQTPPMENIDAENFTYLSKLITESVQYYKAKEGPGFEERRKRYKPLDNGDLYLGEGKAIKPITWQLLQTEKPKIFLRELSIKIWEPYHLANRAINVGKVHKPIPNRSPVKSLEKPLLRLLISLYSDFLEKQKGLGVDEKAILLKSCTRVLSQKIRDLRSDMKKNVARRLRY